jgi:hypothetical protein
VPNPVNSRHSPNHKPVDLFMELASKFQFD